MLNLQCLVDKGILTDDQLTIASQLSSASTEELLAILIAIQLAP